MTATQLALRITETVAEHYGLTVAALTGDACSGTVRQPRALAMHFTAGQLQARGCRWPDLMPTLGMLFQCHARTAENRLATVRARLGHDPALDDAAAAIEAKLEEAGDVECRLPAISGPSGDDMVA